MQDLRASDIQQIEESNADGAAFRTERRTIGI
jgi:hypothetical protein